jgi:hypothetical protein
MELPKMCVRWRSLSEMQMHAEALFEGGESLSSEEETNQK